MKPYIYSILFLIIIQSTYAQTKKTILKKSYKVDKSTVFNLDLDNVAIVFEESFDDKIHFEYQLTFYNYTRRKIDDLLDESSFKSSKKENQVFLRAKNSKYLGLDIQYKFNFDFTNFKNPINNAYKDFVKNYYKIAKEQQYAYKTQDSLIKEIEFSIGSDMNNYIKRNIDNYPLKKELKTDKKIEKRFIIKIPKYVQLNIQSIESDIEFKFDISTNLKIESFKGTFKFTKISGKNNQITSSNGILETIEIKNSRIDLRDMYKIKIGSISNSKIKSETSKIKIGEINKKTTITDFNSKIHLYNFKNTFKDFSFEGDYTKLNLYKVKESNYAMNVFGLKTTLNMNNTKTTFGTSNEKEFTKILEKKPKANSSGTIEIKLKNGILNIN